jgi:hypothetical protein
MSRPPPHHLRQTLLSIRQEIQIFNQGSLFGS